MRGLTLETAVAADMWRRASPHRPERRDGEVWIVATGASPGQLYHPHRRPGLEDEILALRHASDARLAAWADHWGLLGLEGDRSADAERASDMRTAAMRLAACRGLLAELRSPAPSRRRLHRLTCLLPGPPGWRRSSAWRKVGQQAGLEPELDTLRPTLPVDLAAIDAIGRELTSILEPSATVEAIVVSTRYTIRLRPALTAHGPLAVVALRLLRELAGLRFNRTSEGRRLLRRHERRQCPGCGEWFEPERSNQRFHSKACRWRVAKAEQRAAARQGGQQ
jgi:hypothetical protein